MAARGTRGHAGPPGEAPDDLRTPPPAPLSVAAVARRLGVAPATLRTWDRRYGIGPTQHAAGAHRRYQPGDVARLDVMRRLTRAGVNPSDAAVAALAEGPAAALAPGSPAPVSPAGRGGGGRVVALPTAGERTRGLARAAMALDAAAVSTTIRSSLREHGVIRTWDDLLAPALTGIGRRWEATGEGVDVEHLLSECVIGAMSSVRPGPGRPGARAVLLASAEEEMHSLPLYALAAALAERGVPSRLLGARVPRDALAAAFRRVGPPALFVWSQSAATGDPGQLVELPSLRPRPSVVVGGSGWPQRLPPGVVRAESLPEALGALLAAAA